MLPVSCSERYIYERRKTSEGIRISESGYICKKEYICDKYNVEQRIL